MADIQSEFLELHRQLAVQRLEYIHLFAQQMLAGVYDDVKRGQSAFECQRYIIETGFAYSRLILRSSEPHLEVVRWVNQMVEYCHERGVEISFPILRSETEI